MLVLYVQRHTYMFKMYMLVVSSVLKLDRHNASMIGSWSYQRGKTSHCYGLAVVSPYVGMAQFQNGGSNQCISVFTAISSPGSKC